ncbi:MAG: helix-turn-helix transcriptional regulator [Christensenellaceae bacterium]|nr:helix-turn-helix transcriptional regulator [Christensenellaceae bacterium]
MDEEFIRARITKLRLEKNVSAREMSLSIGQSENYINQIENARGLPSLPGLIYICDYLGITLQQFFDDGDDTPYELQVLLNDLKKLDADALAHVTAVVRAFLPR